MWPEAVKSAFNLNKRAEALEEPEPDVGAEEPDVGALVYIQPTDHPDVHPLDRTLPATMDSFIDKLQESPLEVYRSLVNQVYRFGENFPFPPYREVMTHIQSFLKKREAEDPRVADLLQEVSRELDWNEGPRFTSSARLVETFLNLFPENSIGLGGLKDQIDRSPAKRGFNPVQFREEDGVVVFRYICNKDLNLMYFVNARAVPVFALGVGDDEGLNPTDYDAVKGEKRFLFWDHDIQHTDIMWRQESKYALLRFWDKIRQTRNVWESIPNCTYKVKEYCALLQQIKSELAKVEDTVLKKAIEAMLFFFLHEDMEGV